MSDLPDKERLALQYTSEYVREQGFAPSRRDMARDLSVTVGHAHLLVERLEKRGLVERKGSASRALVITDAGRALLLKLDGTAPDGLVLSDEFLETLLAAAIRFGDGTASVTSFVDWCHEVGGVEPPYADLDSYIVELARG